ncbi:hypothetical protein MGN70_013131 [Eutypa lata]|nr:hypothetical protein MGN70_013131 [Eutypa lata]
MDVWQFPGGHLDYGETYFACAERETLEETGLKVKAVKLVGVTNDIFEDVGKHYVTLFVVCQMEDLDAKPETVEPDKCEGWYWVRWEEVREWCSHHDDTGIEWADKKCFLPIKHLAEEQPQVDFSI